MEYNYIINPNTNKKCSIFSKKGKKILEQYLQYLNNQYGGEKKCNSKKGINKMKCTQGPCWNGNIFIGDKCYTKGSCINRDKLCRKKTGKGIECKSKINCKKLSNKKSIIKEEKKNISLNIYNKCLKDAEIRHAKGELKLCPRGYCTAKNLFEVYPSAYANGYASQVCKGNKPDLNDKTNKDVNYQIKKKSNLNRWFDEKWVNVCQKNRSKEGYKVCGSGKGINKLKEYPYCRPYYNLDTDAPISVSEIIDTAPELNLNVDDIFDSMCKLKRNEPQGVDGKPTYVRIEETYPKLVKKIKSNRNSKNYISENK